MVVRFVVIVILINSISATSYPDCSNSSTYTGYGKSTEYKGLNDNTAWDRTSDNGDTCDFSSGVPIVQPSTCGDCDFDLVGGKWYRFDQGPYVQIAEFSDKTSCPQRGHCNGFYQIALVSSDIDSGNSQSKKYYVIYSEATTLSDCTVAGDDSMVEEFYCDEFVLYKFPDGWKNANVCTGTKDDQGRIAPTPYSLCMNDTVIDLSLTANRKYYTKEGDFPLICSSTRSPKPPNITWTDQDDQDVTSQATRDTALSSFFTAVYSLDSSTSYSSVTCQVDDKSHTFYRVSLEAGNVTGIAGKEVTATCNVTFDKFAPENKENLYLIEVLDDSEVYYTSLNISTRGDTMKIDKEDPGTYKITLTNVRNKTESWKCGVGDPLTEIYTTVPFTVTLKSCDPGKGFPTEEATQCEICPKNTFSSSRSQCRGCSDGSVSGSGASRCFQIVAKDETGLENRELITTCSIILDRFSDKIEENLYLIKVLEGEEVYYTPKNITGDQMQVVKVGSGTYNISLVLSDPSVPANVRIKTENWKCGVGDPITEIYTTVPFSVTIKKYCIPGTGFVTADATECVECPEDTFSNQNKCEECPKGEVSQPGSDRCRKKPSAGAVYYAVAGVGGALLIILALMIAALIWTRRRQENNNIVIANPSNDNGRPTNKNSAV